MSKVHLQQWQQYNPLDKSSVLPNIPKSNKLPYAKDDSGSTNMHMQPKVCTTGEVDELKVMMVGNSALDLPSIKQDKNHKKKPNEDLTDNDLVKTEAQTKMPAILNTEGTTTQAQFVQRGKPPSKPRFKAKRRRRIKPTVPPNSSKAHLRNTPSAGDMQTDASSITSPTNEGTVMSVEITEPTNSTPVRSIDDMIQTLRSSRHTSATKSISDVKIDEILQQVMSHAREWMEEEAPPVENEKLDLEPNLFDEEASPRATTERRVEVPFDREVIEVDVSDTVSTLASQISAPAGIPDVSSILMRKSSHALRGGSSQFSVLSTPAAMLHDEENNFDYKQAVQDFHLSLDVKNDDIISIHGGVPPLIEKPAKPATNEDQEIHDGYSSDKSQPLFTTGGRIHRLCLLPSIDELQVTPHEFALTKAMHTGEFPNKKYLQIESKPPNLKPTSQFIYATPPQPHADDGSVRKEQTNPLDTSKLDPLDIEGWKKVVEDQFETVDYTLGGTTVHTDDWGLWRMMWTHAPPKMALSTTAVQALVFPKYHGTQASYGDTTASRMLHLEEQLTEMSLEEMERSEYNAQTLLKRHASLSDLPEEMKNKADMLRRSCSEPNLSLRGDNKPLLPSLVKTSYTTGMAEVGKQKELIMEQHMRLHRKDDHELDITKHSHDTEIISQPCAAAPHLIAKQPLESTGVSESVLLEKSSQLSLAAQAREAGRDYVVYSTRKLRSKRSKRYVMSARKSLTSYIPHGLIRSTSIDSFLQSSASTPGRRRWKSGFLGRGKLSRSTSVPRLIDFDWFISRHQKYAEPIEELREWVRDIWNVWFDELFPSSSSSEEEEEESSCYSSDDNADAVEVGEDRGDAGKREHKNIPVPDSIPAVVTRVDDEVDCEEMMRREVERLTEDIDNLREEQIATKACHLSRRGALLRKLGEIKKASEDLDSALAIEPRLTQAYWQRHLIKLLRNQQHEALDDLNALLKINKTNVDAYRSRADIFAALGDYTMAIVNYSQAIKLDPTNEETYFQRAQKFEKTGDMLLAMEDYGSVVTNNPTRTDALMRRAEFYFRKKSWHSAIADFSQLIEKEPLNPQARSYRGRAYAAMGQSEKALVDLSAAIHLDPMNASAFYHRGSLLRAAAPERSLQDLSISFLLDDSEQNILAVLHRGILYAEMKRYQEAMSDFEQTLRLDHSMACAHVNIGLIHLQVTENYWEAIRRFTFAIKGDPTYARSYVCRSDALARIHDYQSAVRDITRAIHLQPTERHLYLRRGKLLLHLRKLKLAAFCVRHIATLEKGFVSTSPTQQAVVQSFLGNHTAAVDSLSTACRTKPKPHMYVLLSKTLMKAKRFKEAITNLNNALELSTMYTYGATSGSTNDVPLEAAEMHFLLGQCYTEQEKHNEALTAYNMALKVNPNYAEACYQRGLCRLKLDQSKGIQDLNRALSLQPTLFEAFLSRAAYYSTKQRYSKAILNCNEALRLRPKSIRALLCRGGLKFRISAFRHALSDLSAAIELDKQCSFAYYNRGVVLQAIKRHIHALKDYSIVLVLTDSDDEENSDSKSLRVRVLVNRALLYLSSEMKDPGNAALDLERAAQLKPEETSILHTMAICYHRLQDLNSAYTSYTRCIDVDPSFLTAYVGRGDVLADADHHDRAQEEYNRVIQLDRDNVDARVHLGYSLQVCGRLQEAWNQFSSAIELDPTSQSALEGRAITCLHAGNHDAAIKDMTSALRSGPHTARLLTACGVVHQSMKDLHTAMAYYNKARSLDTWYTPAAYNCAVLYMRNRQFSEAEGCLDAVLDDTPDDTAALLNRANARIFLNKTELSLEDFNRTIELDPLNGHAYFNRGNLYDILKEYEKAEKDFTTAFEINPGDYSSLKKRADVRGRLGRREDAVEDYREALLLHERRTRRK